jgi:hypothetical protein
MDDSPFARWNLDWTDRLDRQGACLGGDQETSDQLPEHFIASGDRCRMRMPSESC